MKSLHTFVDLLNDRRPEDEKILVALRYYVSEITDDKLPRELLAEVQGATGDPRQIQKAVEQLKGDRGELVQTALAFLSDCWEDHHERDRIVRAFEGAATKLPVIETGIIAIVGMYAMFLIATRGRRKFTRRVTRRPDGSFEETVEQEMFGPTGPLQAVFSWLKGAEIPDA